MITLFSRLLDKGYICTFIKKTDKYRNTVFESRNDNIGNWLIAFIFGNAINIITIVSYLYNKLNIVVMLMILLIFAPFTIYSGFQINRIRKLKLKINLLKIIEIVFMSNIIILVFSGLFIIATGFDIEKITIDKIMMFSFVYIMLMGLLAFIYTIILAIKTRIKKINNYK